MQFGKSAMFLYIASKIVKKMIDDVIDQMERRTPEDRNVNCPSSGINQISVEDEFQRKTAKEEGYFDINGCIRRHRNYQFDPHFLEPFQERTIVYKSLYSTQVWAGEQPTPWQFMDRDVIWVQWPADMFWRHIVKECLPILSEVESADHLEG